MSHFYFAPRVFCDLLEEMRVCFKTYNFGPIAGLIEEIQIIGNRMEAGLDASKSLVQITDEIALKKKELAKVQKDLEDAKETTE